MLAQPTRPITTSGEGPPQSYGTEDAGGGGGGGGGYSPDSPSVVSFSPTYDDDKKSATATVPTLAESYATYFGKISSGELGGLLPQEEYYNMDGSAQPLAPQAPGNVLYGRFGETVKTRGVWIAGALLLAVVIWYFWRKRSSA